MSGGQKDIFEQFKFEQSKRYDMKLASPLTAILDYLQYLIRTDFNASDKSTMLRKNRKSELNKELRATFTTLSRQQKILYYCMVMTYLLNFINSNFVEPKSNFTGMLNANGFSRSFNIKRWKQKKLRLDLDKHILYAERQQKIKSYDLRNYILRRSKNKQYHCFVLEAINNVPHQKSMTVHIGFQDEKRLQEWWSALRFCIYLKQWEFYKHIYQTSGQNKSKKMHNQEDERFSSSMYIQKTNNSQKVQMSESMVVDANPNKLSYEKTISKGDMVIPQDLKEVEYPVIFKRQERKEIVDKIQEREKIEGEIKAYELQRRKTYVDDLIQGEVFEEPDVFQEKLEGQTEDNKQQKRQLDLFHKLYPQYELDELEIFANFEMTYDQDNIKIYQHTILERRIKMFAIFSKDRYTRQMIMSMISKPETAHTFNDDIQSVQLKTFIPSQNSAVMYQLNKAYNRLYRARDFVFIRHVFSVGSKVYMVDKSIEYGNIPPFLTIVRGSHCNVYGLFERNGRFQLMVDFQVKNSGLLNPVQESNLTFKFIRAFKKMFEVKVESNAYQFFQLDWDISKNKENQIQKEIRVRRKTLTLLQKDIKEKQYDDANSQPRNFSKKNNESVTILQSQSNPTYLTKQLRNIQQIDAESNISSPAKRQTSSQGLQSPVKRYESPKKIEVKRFDQKTMEEVGEIKIEQKKVPLTSIINQLDKEGRVIIKHGYIKQNYIIEPVAGCKMNRMQRSNGIHPIWQQDWQHNDKEGGLIFVNKPKTELQKGVLSFVLRKMAKNILSGQSPTTISLPVDIFSVDSNLERFLYGMSYAPIFLEKLQKQNAINRLLKVVGYGISNSILYLCMQKPFNPILGETFQCWINGCPAYAEQISHHPPIAAIYMKGRGYTVSGCFQSVVNLSINSGTGVNDGIYTVRFDDGMEICFMTPGGQVSGLTAGDRKFNLVNKSYYWVKNENIVLEIAFDPFKKGFFSKGKPQKPADYFQGIIYEVKPDFMEKFVKGKKKAPEEKERIRDFGKVSGVWNKVMHFNGVQIFSPETQYPVIMEYESNPLPSDSNWREDIEYRRRLQIPKAQTEKERLEVVQRKDRKLRAQYGKKKK